MRFDGSDWRGKVHLLRVPSPQQVWNWRFTRTGLEWGVMGILLSSLHGKGGGLQEQHATSS